MYGQGLAQEQIQQFKSNYTWNTQDPLGQGATANVFKGRKLSNGQPVAVKVFKIGTNLPTLNTYNSEVKAMRRLQHRNIVKMLDYGDLNHNPVIVMELCTGQDVFSLLMEPENFYGLSEREFLTFFKDIISGFKHLVEQGYMHRDLKPNNILQHRDPQGNITYKIGDFGTAKEITQKDREGHMSLQGTVEYLHPRTYEKAFVDRNLERGATADEADLWSLGATFYHALTSKNPFRPLDGRKNKNVMMTMISTKPVGVISAHQDHATKAIIWERELPPTCRLSPCYHPDMTELLYKMMEKDERLRWTSGQAIKKSEQLVSKLKLSVLNLGNGEVHSGLIPSNQPINRQTLPSIVCDITRIAPGQQQLLESSPLQGYLSESHRVATCSRATELPPIVLMGTACPEAHQSALPAACSLAFKSIQGLLRAPRDDEWFKLGATAARETAGTAYLKFEAMKHFHENEKIVAQTIQHQREAYKLKNEALQLSSMELKTELNQLISQLSIIKAQCDTLHGNFNETSNFTYADSEPSEIKKQYTEHLEKLKGISEFIDNYIKSATTLLNKSKSPDRLDDTAFHALTDLSERYQQPLAHASDLANEMKEFFNGMSKRAKAMDKAPHAVIQYNILEQNDEINKLETTIKNFSFKEQECRKIHLDSVRQANKYMHLLSEKNEEINTHSKRLEKNKKTLNLLHNQTAACFESITEYSNKLTELKTLLTCLQPENTQHVPAQMSSIRMDASLAASLQPETVHKRQQELEELCQESENNQKKLNDTLSSLNEELSSMKLP